MKYILALIILLSPAASQAIVVNCSDLGQHIADLEKQIRVADLDANAATSKRRDLDNSYRRYYKVGCSEAELKGHFSGDYSPRGK